MDKYKDSKIINIEKKLRILYVATWIPYPKPCGGSTHVDEVARHLKARGHKVVVAAKKINGLGKEKVNGLDVHRFSWILKDVPYTRTLIRKLHSTQLIKICVENKIDIVLERESSDGSGFIAAKILGLPMVEEVNDLRYYEPSLKYAQKIICVTMITNEIIPDKFRDKVEIVANAVDTEKINPKVKPKQITGINKNNTVVGYIGAFYSWHGLDEISKAVEKVCKETNAIFVLIGDVKFGTKTNLKVKMKNHFKKIGLQNRVIFTGTVPHDKVSNYLAAFDICIAPYNPAKHEPFKQFGFFFSPLKIFEYLAAGKAIVATDVGSISKLLENDRGYLIPPGDPDRLAEAIIELINDPKKRARLGNNAWKYAKANSWAKRSEEIEGFLFEAIRNHGN